MNRATVDCFASLAMTWTIHICHGEEYSEEAISVSLPLKENIRLFGDRMRLPRYARNDNGLALSLRRNVVTEAISKPDSAIESGFM